MSFFDKDPSTSGYTLKRLNTARVLASRKLGETLEDVAARADISVRQLHRYLDNDEFREMVIRLTDHSLVQFMPQVDRAMLKEALEGSVAAANYLAKRSGRLEDVTRNKSFEKWLERLDNKDREELSFFLEHGYLPDENRAQTMDEPESVQ